MLVELSTTTMRVCNWTAISNTSPQQLQVGFFKLLLFVSDGPGIGCGEIGYQCTAWRAISCQHAIGPTWLKLAQQKHQSKTVTGRWITLIQQKTPSSGFAAAWTLLARPLKDSSDSEITMTQQCRQLPLQPQPPPPSRAPAPSPPSARPRPPRPLTAARARQRCPTAPARPTARTRAS